MKYKILIISFVLTLFCIQGKTQSFAEIGYTNINGNMLKLGFKKFNKSFKYSYGINTYWGFYKKTFIVNPELSLTGFVTKRDVFTNKFTPMLRLGASPFSLTPEAGISYGSFVEISAGYGFKMLKYKNFNPKGIRINVAICIPLKMY